MKTLLQPEHVAEQVLANAINWANAHPGRKTLIAADLAVLTGRPISRQMVEKWLHHEPEKRREPLLGIGLALIAVCTNLQPVRADLCINRTAKPGTTIVEIPVTILAAKTTTKK